MYNDTMVFGSEKMLQAFPDLPERKNIGVMFA